MADTSEMLNYFTKDDFNSGDIVKFLDAGKLRTKEFGNVKTIVLDIMIECNGKQKTMAFNHKAIENLKKEWGKNTDEWIGKSAVVEKFKTMAYGKLQDIINLMPNQY